MRVFSHSSHETVLSIRLDSQHTQSVFTRAILLCHMERKRYQLFCGYKTTVQRNCIRYAASRGDYNAAAFTAPLNYYIE